MDLAKCGEIGRSQDGLITRAQALQFLSPAQVLTLIRNGSFIRVHAAVFRMAGTPSSYAQALRAATLTRPGEVVASHRSAAWLWGMLDRPPQRIEVLVPYTRSSRAPGLLIHRSRVWDPATAQAVNGILLTPPARTLIDFATVSSKRAVLRAVDTTIVKRLTTLKAVHDELVAIGTRGRARCSQLFDVLELRDGEFERTESEAEIDVLNVIRSHGLPEPTAQLRIVLDAKDTARPDFAYPQLKIAIEVMSWRWHGGPAKFEEDIRRRAKLQALGWLIVEVTKRMRENDLVAAVSSAIALREAAAS